jgi:NAD(P)-dependent dehydrogenase (short-subunit alcohol dehydrogenase family)
VAGILQDEVAVVTGAAPGIGRATVEAFLEEGARCSRLDVDA